MAFWNPLHSDDHADPLTTKTAELRNWAQTNGLKEGRDFFVIEHSRVEAKAFPKLSAAGLLKKFLGLMKGGTLKTLRGFQTPLGIDFIATTLILLLSIIFYVSFIPSVDVEYRRGSESFKKAELPIFVDTIKKPMVVRMKVKIPFLHPRKIGVWGDDCFTKFLVDNHEVDIDLFRPCDYNQEYAVETAKIFTPGVHNVEIHIDDMLGKTGFNFRVAPNDPVNLGFQVFISMIISIWMYLLVKIFKIRNFWLFAIFTAGVLLRLLNFNFTPYWIRTNDVYGHIEYIQWILDHGSMPRAALGWEFFQPPLYYASSALFGWAGLALLGTKKAMFWAIQFQSFLASIATLGIAGWIGMAIFPKERDRRKLYLFFALIAVWPLLIMNSSKINNDVFFQLFSFLTAGFLVRFWQTGSRFMWYGALLAIILGVLSKINALLLIPPAFLCLLLSRKTNFEQKIMLGALGVLTFLAFTEWFYVLRYVGENLTFPVGNIGGLGDNLRVRNDFWSFLGFHPIRFIKIEYINAFDDKTGRNYFFEYFMKTSLYGEYPYGMGKWPRYLARTLNASLLVIFSLSAWGVLRGLVNKEERKHSFPLLALLIIVVAGHMLLKYKSPFGCSQDFRYSIVAIVPIIYYAITGVGALPGYLRYPLKFCLWAFAALCVIFITLIPIL